jgi:GntR family transcriptional regulator
LDIVISNASRLPIYEQIYTQIKNCILSGELSEGDLLPSIRALAKDLRISVITTRRAYDELEKNGYINTVAGKGSYVAGKNKEMIREEHLKQIENHMRAIFNLAPACELSLKNIMDMFQVVYKEEQHDECN